MNTQEQEASDVVSITADHRRSISDFVGGNATRRMILITNAVEDQQNAKLTMMINRAALHEFKTGIPDEMS